MHLFLTGKGNAVRSKTIAEGVKARVTYCVNELWQVTGRLMSLLQPTQHGLNRRKVVGISLDETHRQLGEPLYDTSLPP